MEAGLFNNGDFNSFFGNASGQQNTTGVNNSYFGASAGLNNTDGQANTFVGSNVGFANTTGSNNTLLGSNTNVGSNNLNFATAIGSGATVSTSNTIVLGRSNGADRIRVPELGTAGSIPLCRNANIEGKSIGMKSVLTIEVKIINLSK